MNVKKNFFLLLATQTRWYGLYFYVPLLVTLIKFLTFFSGEWTAQWPNTVSVKVHKNAKNEREKAKEK